MKIRITPPLIGNRPPYEKYVSPLINLANRFAQATRPKQVGQVSVLIRECPAQDYEGWRDWYLARYPEAINEAADQVFEMLEKLRAALNNISRETVLRWVTELILEQTYVGLRVERAILEEAARCLGRTLSLSSPEDESRGIDGYLDGIPVSVKPNSYKAMDTIGETINARMIYYDKMSSGTIVAHLDDLER